MRDEYICFKVRAAFVEFINITNILGNKKNIVNITYTLVHWIVCIMKLPSLGLGEFYYFGIMK